MSIKLDDYVDLRAFHNDMAEWRRTTESILGGERRKEQNMEFLKSHLE